MLLLYYNEIFRYERYIYTYMQEKIATTLNYTSQVDIWIFDIFVQDLANFTYFLCMFMQPDFPKLQLAWIF